MRAVPSGMVQRASDLTAEAAGVGPDRLLPVAGQLRDLLPAGLRRGSTVAITDTPGSRSLLLALLAETSRAGSWCAVVGLPALGMAAAAEQGISLERLAVVPDPGPDWPTVVAALLDGFDVVAAAVGRVTASVGTQLAARARQRGSVLVPFGGSWDGAEVTLSPVAGRWFGIGEGASRRLTVSARGRGAAVHARRAQVWLPGPAVPETPSRLRVVR